ncbi:MAG: hypothetical protein K7J46_21840 [Bryobacter sp.]|nr:hypothetical protein [Bryobacter sp. CoA8 C33]
MDIRHMFPAAAMLALSSCVTLVAPDTGLRANSARSDRTAAPQPALGRGQVVSAFFGVDNRLPLLARFRVCEGAGQRDGIVLVFDRELDPATIEAGDIAVRTQSGRAGEMVCVTLMPAADEGERRSLLLVGEFGNAGQDPPAEVEIVGHLLSRDKEIDYRGGKRNVMPLEAGPMLVWAERVTTSGARPGKGLWARGSACPAGTAQALLVTWSGAVRRRDGDELTSLERSLYEVVMEDGRRVEPFALGDLDDGDNHHLLCLRETGQPVQVQFPAGPLGDANQDANPATQVVVRDPR